MTCSDDSGYWPISCSGGNKFSVGNHLRRWPKRTGTGADATRLELGQPFTNRILGEAGDGMYAELLHKMFAVCVNSLHAEVELECDLLDRHLLNKLRQLFPFPVR